MDGRPGSLSQPITIYLYHIKLVPLQMDMEVSITCAVNTKTAISYKNATTKVNKYHNSGLS